VIQAHRARLRQKGGVAREEKSASSEGRLSSAREELKKFACLQVQEFTRRFLEEYRDEVKSPTVTAEDGCLTLFHTY
jgi:hypothetical protein